MAETHLYLDRERKLFVSGPLDATPLRGVLTFFQEDSSDVVLHGVKLNPDPATSLVPLVNDPIVFTTIKLALGYGPDAAPAAGTFKLRMVGGAVTTTPLTYPVTKPTVLAALNALPETVATGATVEASAEASPANFFLFRWSNPAITAVFEVVENRLAPFCFWRSVIYPLPSGQIQLLKLFKAPVAFAQNFVNPAAPAVQVASVRAGTGTRNCVQSITVPQDAMGTVSFKFSSNSTAIVAVNTLNSTSSDGSSIVANALNGIYADSVSRFTVTHPASGVYYVESVGPLALSDQPLLEVEMHDQEPQDVAVGSLKLNGPAIEFALMGKPSLDLVVELEITNGVKVDTPIQQKARLLNDMIDNDMSVGHDPDWEAVIVDPIDYPDYDPSATITGQLYYVTLIGNAATSSFEIVHNLGTLNCHVTVRQNGNGNHRVPDDRYVTTYLDQNRIQVDFVNVPNFVWDHPPLLNEFVVIISGATSNTVAFPHQHAIGDIIGLQPILDALTGGQNPLDLWPSIPESKLPAHIGWYNANGTLRFDRLPSALLPRETAILDGPREDGGRLLVTELPYGTPYYDPTTGTVVINLPGPPPITVTLLDPTLHFPVDVLPLDPSSWPGLITAIIKALQAGAPLPKGYVPFIIPPLKEDFPAAAAILGASGKTMPAGLPRAIPGFAAGGAISGGLPIAAAATINTLYTVAGGASSLPERGRGAQTFAPGAQIICDGYQWFEAVTEGADAYPREMERELFTGRVTPDMMPTNSQFAFAAVIYLSLTGAAAISTRGQYRLRIEVGSITGPLLNAMTFTTVLDKVLLLSTASIGHSFGYTVTRPSSRTAPATALTTMYANDQPAMAPSSFDFVVRAALECFDLEDLTNNATGAAPVGQVHVELKNAVASVARI